MYQYLPVFSGQIQRLTVLDSSQTIQHVFYPQHRKGVGPGDKVQSSVVHTEMDGPVSLWNKHNSYCPWSIGRFSDP